jgi:hypothetical protein
MGDAVDIDRRLPQTWAALADGRLEAWVARKIADATRVLDADSAAWVDLQVADLLGTMPPGRLLAVVEARVKEADQELADRIAGHRARQRGVWTGRDAGDGNLAMVARGDAAGIKQVGAQVSHLAHLLRRHCPDLASESDDELRGRAFCMLGDPMAQLKLLVGTDEHEPAEVPDVLADAVRTAPPEKFRPRAVVYVHLTPDTLAGEGVARAEELGALTHRQLRELLGHHHVTLKPVIDLNTEVAADCYEVPAAISEQLGLARPADCFPYAQSLSRKQDQDHTIRYQWNGPPGQTRVSNLGRMTRRHHRIKTFAGWRVWQREGRFTWISPHGRIYLTDARGTHQVSMEMGTNPIEIYVDEFVLAS